MTPRPDHQPSDPFDHPEASGATDPFEDALSHAPKPPPIPEILTKPVDHPAASGRSEVINSGASRASGDAGAAGGLGGIGKAWGMAMDFVFTIIASVGLGYVASIWLGHRQAWVLGGLGVGFAAAMVRIVRTTMREEAREQARRRAGASPMR